MKKLPLLLFALGILLSCKPNTNEQTTDKQKTLSQEEVEQCIAVMRLYQNVDSQLLEEQNNFYQLMLRHTKGGQEPTQAENDFFLNNVTHIDSVCHQAIALAKSNNANELRTLLDEEMMNFYSHPNNTIENEVSLHYFIINSLSHDYDDMLKQHIKLYGWSIMRMESSPNKHPLYTDILSELLTCYIAQEDFPKAIETGEKIGAYAKAIGEDDTRVYSTTLLSYIYKQVQQNELSDSCENSIKDIVQLYPQAKQIAYDFLYQ
jgi:hypothetical protein